MDVYVERTAEKAVKCNSCSRGGFRRRTTAHADARADRGVVVVVVKLCAILEKKTVCIFHFGRKRGREGKGHTCRKPEYLTVQREESCGVARGPDLLVLPRTL